MKSKVLIVASIWPFFNFEKHDIRILQELGYEVHCATNFKEDNGRKVDIHNVVKHQVDFSRSPFSFQTVVAFYQLRKLLSESSFQIVHCHTPVASIITRVLCKKYRKKGMKVIYTSHGYHFYKGSSLKNWLLYYPIEKICSKWTDIIITINEEDYNLTKTRFKKKKVFRIPGVGIDVSRFSLPFEIRTQKREEFGIRENDVVILSVGEVNDNKNHKLIIESLAKLKDGHIHYFIAGNGDKIEENICLAKNLSLENNVHFLGYRSDIAELNAMADIFAFPSIREGLGLAAIEALASGVPVIGMNTRGINEYVMNGKTGYLFNNNIEECVRAIKEVCELVKTNANDISQNCIMTAQKYSYINTKKIMKDIYTDL